MSKESHRIKELEERLAKFEKSPVKPLYLSVNNKMLKWAQQIDEADIDITNPEHKLQFEMVHKYFTEMISYVKTLEELKSKLLPDEVKEVEIAGQVELMIKEFSSNGKSGIS